MCEKCDKTTEIIRDAAMDLIKKKSLPLPSKASFDLERLAQVLTAVIGPEKALELTFNVAYELGHRKATADEEEKLNKLDKKMEVM